MRIEALPDVLTCSVCEQEMEGRIEGSCQGAWCPCCLRWGVVTTYWPPILLDEQVYEVRIARLPHPTPDQLRLIARVTGGNLLQARRAAMAGPVSLFSGLADDVVLLCALLERHGLAYEVTPGFRWTVGDASGRLGWDSPWHTRQAIGDRTR